MKPHSSVNEVKGIVTASVVLCLLVSMMAFAQGTQQERLALMKSRGQEASLTILPIIVVGNPFDRASEIVGVLLEQRGMKNMEVGKSAFQPGASGQMKTLAAAVGESVKKRPIATQYALYAEYTGSKQTGIDGIRAVIVDSMGAVIWMESLGPDDEAVRKVPDPDPMGFSLLLVERLAPQFGLNEETAKGAKPGKFARLFEERSGIPPESERAGIPQRQKTLRESKKTSTLMIFPALVGDAPDSTTSPELVKMITDAKLCKAVPASQALILKVSRNPNELKMLWDLAREFRAYVRNNPPAADYALYADYGLDARTRQVGFVHFIVCDRKGDWVIVALENSAHPDFQAIHPTSSTDCSALVVRRLGAFLKLSVADLIREKIGASGIDAAQAAFQESRAKQEEYRVSEEEMNQLGYEYLGAKRYKEAIAVFAMNVESFPGSFNVYDSLGEAYAAAGERDLAIKNYEKSVQLNPKSESGISALKKLKTQ